MFCFFLPFCLDKFFLYRFQQVRISDEKMEEFCLAEDAGVYMTGSALLAIMESFIDTSREWLIPFQVKELTQGMKARISSFNSTIEI